MSSRWLIGKCMIGATYPPSTGIRVAQREGILGTCARFPPFSGWAVFKRTGRDWRGWFRQWHGRTVLFWVSGSAIVAGWVRWHLASGLRGLSVRPDEQRAWQRRRFAGAHPFTSCGISHPGGHLQTCRGMAFGTFRKTIPSRTRQQSFREAEVDRLRHPDRSQPNIAG